MRRIPVFILTGVSLCILGLFLIGQVPHSVLADDPEIDSSPPPDPVDLTVDLTRPHEKNEAKSLACAEQILFHNCKLSIKNMPPGGWTFKKMAKAIKKDLDSGTAYWLIDGHTCSQTCAKPNSWLSWHRANRIKEELVKEGVPEIKLKIRGFAANWTAPGLTPSDPGNRRVWIHATYPPKEAVHDKLMCSKPSDL